MMCHWVGHLKIKHIDVERFYRRKVTIDELEHNLNDNNKSEASIVEKIQEDVSVYTEEKN